MNQYPVSYVNHITSESVLASTLVRMVGDDKVYHEDTYYTHYLIYIEYDLRKDPAGRITDDIFYTINIVPVAEDMSSEYEIGEPETRYYYRTWHGQTYDQVINMYRVKITAALEGDI